MKSGQYSKVAIIGAGYMAREHILAFQDIEGVVVSGIYSKNRARAEVLAEEFGISNICETIDELYFKTKANIVVIAVPELATKTVCSQCFIYDWSCLIEKPVGYNLSEALEIYKLSKTCGARAYIAMNRRHFGSTNAVLQELENVSSGMRFIKIQDQQSPRIALEAGQPQLVVDNWMFANSIHLIDYFTLFCRGSVMEVNPILPYLGDSTKILVSKIAFDSGDIGLYESIWNGPGPWSVSINVSEIRWELRPLENAYRQDLISRKLNPLPDCVWDKKFKPGLRKQAILMIEASKGLKNSLPTLSEGIKTMKLIDAIYRNSVEIPI